MECKKGNVFKSIALNLRVFEFYYPKTYQCAGWILLWKIGFLLGILVVWVLLIFVNYSICLATFSGDYFLSVKAITVYFTSFQIIWTHVSCAINYRRMMQAVENLGIVTKPRKFPMMYLFFQCWTVHAINHIHYSNFISRQASTSWRSRAHSC